MAKHFSGTDSYKWPSVDSQQENEGLNPTNARNWILQQPHKPEEDPQAPDNNAAQPIPWLESHETLSKELREATELWTNKQILF